VEIGVRLPITSKPQQQVGCSSTESAVADITFQVHDGMLEIRKVVYDYFAVRGEELFDCYCHSSHQSECVFSLSLTHGCPKCLPHDWIRLDERLSAENAGLEL